MAKISKRGRKAPPRARRKTLAPKRNIAPRKAGDAGLKQQLAEARAQQAATAEILRVISRSPGDVQPVLEAVASSAARLCEAKDVIVLLREGDALRYRVHHGEITPGAPLGETKRISRDWSAGRCAAEGRQLHIHDILAAPDEFPEGSRMGKHAGYRTVLMTPLLRDGVVLGVIGMRRAEVRPFEPRQIELINTFTDQAVIAIENVRLFNETKESLERQTATAEILKVIASSPADVQPVFDAIAESAMRLFGGHSAIVTRVVGDTLHLAALTATSGAGNEAVRSRFPRPLSSAGLLSSVALSGKPTFLSDYESDPDVEQESKKTARASGYRSMLAVPMLRDGVSIGTIGVTRRESGPFTDHQINLLKTFADQAVIAIENVRLFNETKEALERQTATAEILKVIAGSPTDVQPVFDVIVRSAVRLCGARFGRVYRYDGSIIQMVASYGLSASGMGQVQRTFPRPASDDTIAGRVILKRQPFFVKDIQSDTRVPALSRQMIEALDTRSQVTIPMLRADESIGAISMGWAEPEGFDDKQVALLQTFADQAVIAIENVRLFNETKEALERQTATAEVLASISGSMADTQPVFERIVQKVRQLFGTRFAVLQILRGDMVEMPAVDGDPGFERLRESYPRPVDEATAGGLAMLSKQTVQFAPVLDNPATPQATIEFARTFGFNSVIFTPMIHDGKVIGAIGASNKEPKLFDERQIALLKTFADQAVIAIENVRLFNETKEALERQTATAEILTVIASSPSDVQPVFDAIAISAMRLIGGHSAAVRRVIGDALQLEAFTSTDISGDKALRGQGSVPLSSETSSATAARTGMPDYISDVETDDRYSIADRKKARARGFRSVIAVPMMREAAAIGTISVTRRDAGTFSGHQIDLLKTFADQAVIAIENVRLFKELEARTEALTRSVGQLTALGEVGQAISSTLDLETVLQTIVSHAVKLTGLDAGGIYEYNESDETYRLRAADNMSGEIVEILRNNPIRKGEGAVGRTAVTREPVQVPETQDESYQSRVREIMIRSGRRAILAVPLLREDHIIGALAVQRSTPGPFAPEVVELLETFATQSAMAIQNARLFREIAEKSKQLELASQHKSNFLASMSHELRTPLNAILGFNEMIIGQVYGEVPADMQEPLDDIQTSGKHLLRLINNVLDLAKIEAGRMELSLQDYSVHDAVESVRSTLRPLAAEKGLEFLASVPDEIPLAHGDSGRITQCLMNLAGNSLKFTKAGKVEISVEETDGLLTYRVTDTGIGIPPDKIGSLFTEFKQTDATIASEYGGTGLGLSISRKFVEMHGGRIWVESEPGKGSAFIFEVPLRAKTT